MRKQLLFFTLLALLLGIPTQKATAGTVYFNNSQGWDKVYGCIYSWNTWGTISSEELTVKDSNGNYVWQNCPVPADGEYIVFCNNGSTDGMQNAGSTSSYSYVDGHLYTWGYGDYNTGSEYTPGTIDGGGGETPNPDPDPDPDPTPTKLKLVYSHGVNYDVAITDAIEGVNGVFTWSCINIKNDPGMPDRGDRARFYFCNDVDFWNGSDMSYRMYCPESSNFQVVVGSWSDVKTIAPTGEYEIDPAKYFWLPEEGTYDIEFNANTMKVKVTVADTTPILHYLTSAQSASNASHENRLDMGVNNYSKHFDELASGFKIYDSRNKKYLAINGSLPMEETLAISLKDDEYAFNVANAPVHNVDLVISDDLKTLVLNCNYDTWTLVGEFNEWDSNDPAAKFRPTKTTDKEAVEHTLTLSELHGAFKIAKTGETDLESGVVYELKGAVLGKDAPVTLVKNGTGSGQGSGEGGGETPSVEAPSISIYSMWDGYLSATSTYNDGIVAWKNVSINDSWGGPTPVCFVEDKTCYTPTDTKEPDFNTWENALSIVETPSDAAKWNLPNGTYDIYLNYTATPKKISFCNAGTAPSGAQRREAAQNDGVDITLVSGALQNVTLTFNSTTGELSIADADPVYNVVVNDNEANYTSSVTRFTATEEGTFVVTVGQLKGGDKILVAVDHSKTNVYGVTGNDQLHPGEGVEYLTNIGNVTGITVAGSEDDVYNNVTLTITPTDTDMRIFASGGTSETYELIGYYCGWWANHQVQKSRYVFSKVGTGYVLTVPSLSMSGIDTADNGFKIGRYVDGVLTDVYTSNNVISTAAVSSSVGCDLALVTEAPSVADNVLASTGAIVMDSPKNDQWLSTCVLTFNPATYASAMTLNVKGSVSTGVEALEADGIVAPVYNVLGMIVKQNACVNDLRNLAPGIYIFNGKRVLVK